MKCRRRQALVLFLGSFVFASLGCHAVSPRPAQPPVLFLISVDAFRWDYAALHPAETPRFRELAAAGISARSLIPVYPSITFPNHYTMVTGLYPAHHGIIANQMYDPVLDLHFVSKESTSSSENRWWGGEPIWVTAVLQGQRSAAYFWPGDEAEIKGVRPTYWKAFNYDIPFSQRLDDVIGWLHLPEKQRPSVVAFYLREADVAGHRKGPDSPELADALRVVNDDLGAIIDRMKAEGLTANYLIVSDHGMTSISPDRVLVLDDYIDPKSVQVDFQETVAGLRPLAGNPAAIFRQLARMPHAKVYREEDLPARYHMTGNPRIPPIWIVPEEGWKVETREKFDSVKDNFDKGDHGYDPTTAKSMHGILIAEGPAFKSGGRVIDSVDNIHLYNLMCAVLGLKPAPNDGDDRLVKALMR